VSVEKGWAVQNYAAGTGIQGNEKKYGGVFRVFLANSLKMNTK